ncbi:MAG: protease pro-enzyme activation domain-containing protein [Terracidiphilus sp.]
MINSRFFPLCMLASLVFSPVASLAQHAAPAARIVNPVDENQLVTLSGNTHPAAIARNDRGAVSPGLPMPDLTLVLSRSSEQEAAFEAFVASQYDSSSPNYHQWLAPAEIGERFGPASADIAAITAWLTSHGFTVKQVSPDRMRIRFGGTAAEVQSAFHTQIHNLSVNGIPHIANMSDPQIPAALAPVVVGVKALHNFLPRPQHHLGGMVQFDPSAGKWRRIATAAASSAAPAASKLSLSTPESASKPIASPFPQFGINGTSSGSAYLEEDVAPYDFATIYNVLPAWNAGYTGSGQTIAIAGTSFINIGLNGGANDVSSFRSAFGLTSAFPSAPTPTEIDAGSYFSTGTTASICTSTSSTAYCGIGDLEENSLDVEWSGAVAPTAQIDLVVTGQNSSGTIDTLYDSAAYIVDNLTARILSASYGECELGQGTAGNVAYYDLWQTAAAEGISVFISTGDSGSPSCDDDLDEYYGYPYLAQYGLSVNGIASTPYNTAVGGTDFSWCQPYYSLSGNNIDFEGCPTSSTSQGSPAYWATSNSTTGESALGYVPETPWNDTCENPIWARYLETLLSTTGAESTLGISASTPEEACNLVYNDWYQIYEFFGEYYDDTLILAPFVDTVGGSGGASNCVVNSTTDTTVGSCTTGSTTTGSSYGNIALTGDGWPSPSWQASSGVTGTSALTTRAIPDVSFFSGNGSLDSATLICVSNLSTCTYSSTTANTYQEVGGTSVATPQMAGVMALIDQKAGAAQGLAGPQLYSLAAKQTYSSCSAESVKNSSSCYFQDIDYGPTASSGPAYTTAQTNSMPCDLNNSPVGGYGSTESGGTTSPNCTAINSGDTVGTLVSSGTTQAYNAATGFDLATGLGSLNVYNVVSAWVSDAGTGSSTLTVTPSLTTIAINQSLTVTVSVTGSSGTPTGTVTLAGDGYSSVETIGTSPCASNTSCVFTISANSLAAGSSVTLTAYYGGDKNYASNSKAITITVDTMTPTVTVSAPASGNVANSIAVTVSVAGPSGSTATPTGTIYLTSGSYTSSTETIGASPCTSSTSCVITIPANTLSAGTDTITADYSGDSNYSGHTGSTTISMTQTSTLTPTVTVTPSPASIDTGQSLGVTVSVTGSGATPTGTVYVASGSYTSSTETIGASPCTSNTSCSFTIPANKLAAGADTLTATYSGDTNYATRTGTASVTVTQSTYALLASTPAAVSPGSSSTSTITGTASTTDYSGTVTLSSCSLTSSSVTSANYPPSCSVTGTITYASGTASGSGTATLSTTDITISGQVHPEPAGKGRGWLGAGGGAVLALLVFFGIPARRRSWRSMLTILVAMIAIGALSSCGGGGGGGTTTTTEVTSAGTYTFTVTGTGNDSASTVETTTFTLTVN